MSNPQSPHSSRPGRGGVRAAAALAIAGLLFCPVPARAGAFTFAGLTNGEGVVTHVKGYGGVGGLNLVQTVGIDPGSANRTEMAVAVRNVVRTYNNLIATEGNLIQGAKSDLASNQFDFESVLLHEMGHALGLAHSNLASESGLDAPFQDFTKSTAGPNGLYFLNASGDGIKGSRDDLRDDDVNLYWFDKATNNPVAAPPAAVDGTTFSRLLGDLPAGSAYAANSHREVTAALGIPSTEGVLQQGTNLDEAQRTLTHEAVSTLRIAMAGLDAIEGTADDYTFSLMYVGTASADIVIDFDSSWTSFAATLTEGGYLPGSSSHMALLNWADWGHIPIFFSPNINWYFNPASNAPDTANIHADFDAVSNGDGFALTPFDNLTDALAIVEAGGTVHLKPATSSETFVGGGGISQPLRLENSDPGSGSVRLGG